MSLQIEIAQSEKDELDLIGFLLTHERLCALPRLSRQSSSLRLLGREPAAEQAIFREADKELVRASLTTTRDGCSLISPYLGISIEWTRTIRVGPSGYSPGRFYFMYETPVSLDATAALNRVMTALVRYVRRSYPKQSPERYPFYVGPDLARIVRIGEGFVVYGNGQRVELVANPNFREGRNGRSKRGRS